MPPITALGPAAPEATETVQASGLTAIKADLDGSDTFASVSAMIRDDRSVIAGNPRC